MNTIASIKIWNHKVGVVLWDDNRKIGLFEFDKKFLKSNLNISPIHISLEVAKKGRTVFSFPFLNPETYKGLPGFLADCLPDKFGNQIIDAWLAQQGRDKDSFNPVERLCYIGKRSMGALEFEPETSTKKEESNTLEIENLVKFASEILNERKNFKTNLNSENGYNEIFQIGSSAGGARAKAVIAYNKNTGEVKSGQIENLKDFDYWLIKFDGVTNEQLGDPKGYGKIEYAYYLMALDCGINISESLLKKENNRAHFMTKRFDRQSGEKIHMQTLCGLAHFDYNLPTAYSYEQAFQVIREMKLSHKDTEQLFTRMVFNIMARNQDDHTKNISFLMNKEGEWSISPAYDITYAYNPNNFWLKNHQMSINGKRENQLITKKDVLTIAKSNSIKQPLKIIETIRNVLNNWETYAKNTEITEEQITEIKNNFNLLM